MSLRSPPMSAKLANAMGNRQEGAATPVPHSPKMHYPWSETEAALDRELFRRLELLRDETGPQAVS